jgi:hypothetical protein
MGFMQDRAVVSADKKLRKGYDQIIDQAGVTRDQQLGVYKPYKEFGEESLNALKNFERQVASGDYSQVTSAPEYQFEKDEGVNTLDRTNAMRGGLYGGAHMKDVQKFGADLASRQFQNVRNRMLGNIEVGSAGRSGVATAYDNYFNNYANAREKKAIGSANARISRGNVWNEAFKDLAKAFGGGGFG